MTRSNLISLGFLLSVIVIGLIVSSFPKNSTQPKLAETSPTGSPTPQPKDSSCDPSLWNHVYNPSRLKVIEPCLTLTGYIDEVKREKDGDDHILLRLDKGEENYLNNKNIEDQHGDLVLETVCINPATQLDAVAACAGFNNNITIPSRGTHVKVTGSYVLDTAHGWMEIHPVTKFEEM